MKDTFSYVPASNYEYKAEAGMSQKEFRDAWAKKYPPGSGVAMGANAITMMRFDSSEIGQTMSEIVAYGTAVVRQFEMTGAF